MALTDLLSLKLFNVVSLGQVFTPPAVVAAMLALRRRPHGRTLEPSCGDGAFWAHLPQGAVGIELDPAHCPPGALNIDFFAYPETEQFDVIIGNPPYVRYQDIPPATRARLSHEGFDGRSNLYLFFIDKCLRHLKPGGELIFITPRDFMKATSAVALNQRLAALGSITDVIELGDARIFDGAVPNCLIWRFEHGCRDRRVRYASLEGGGRLDALQWQLRHFVEQAGQLMFTRAEYPLRLADLAQVRVGAVSGLDEIYADEAHGNRDFVCSSTIATGLTRRMIWCEPGEPPPASLLPHRARLIARRIRKFDDSNWWEWGRGYAQSSRPRVYVNGRTRATAPFFLHDCPHYDGSVLAVFPHDPAIELEDFRDALNAVDWRDLGFVCDGRHLFTQRSLANAPLPASFARFVRTPAGLDEWCNMGAKE